MILVDSGQIRTQYVNNVCVNESVVHLRRVGVLAGRVYPAFYLLGFGTSITKLKDRFDKINSSGQEDVPDLGTDNAAFTELRPSPMPLAVDPGESSGSGH